VAIAVDAALQDARVRAMPAAADKGVTLVVQAEAVVVSADPALLRAIIDSLVSNAIKLSPTGRGARVATFFA
jgi:signal transduction histidine kinase